MKIIVLLSHRLDKNFTFLFEHWGYDVVWAENIDELKDLLLNNKVDIAIEWDYGDDIIENLIQDLNLNIPVLLSLNYNGQIPENLSARGYIDYLSVPFKTEELITN